MKLLTKSIEAKLRTNAAGPELDHKPVVKFFNPVGAATWLITELDREDIMFGLCDLGMGFPELGSVGLNEMKDIKLPLGLGIERDMYFTANKTLSKYASEARELGRIAA